MSPVPIVPARGACSSNRPGHSLHPTQARHLWQESAEHVRRPVSGVEVEDSGLLRLELADGTVEPRWHHDPGSVRDLLAGDVDGTPALLAEPALLVVRGVGVSVCRVDAITPCPPPDGSVR